MTQSTPSDGPPERPMINRYTVIGQPVAHSLSPIVHHLFGQITEREIQYTKTESTPETFGETVLDWQSQGAKGCNVTAPFKELAATLCDYLSPDAQCAQAVNTIQMLSDGSRHGFNTDGPGLVADIHANHARQLHDKRVLILGAGGAVRGVLAPILRARPALVHIANRTASKAQLLAETFGDQGQLCASGYEGLEKQAGFDLIINATSSSLSGTMPDLPESIGNDRTLAYDMTYAAGETAFLAWAAERGMECVNGLGMLVEQAAESFLIWEGVRPDTKAVYPRLKEILK
ncbi:MAG: shikimate dehydrogenase [Granulosicoccus sp.]|nr:shikimate dehydrogenase [Granulosicoccus sp.]